MAAVNAPRAAGSSLLARSLPAPSPWRAASVKTTVYLLAAFGTGTTGALIYLNLLGISPDAAFSFKWAVATIFIVTDRGDIRFFLVQRGVHFDTVRDA